MTGLLIHRWCNEYQVPRQNSSGLGSPAMQAVNADLDRLAQGIADALATHIAAMLSGDNAGLVLLPELEIACDIDLACPSEQIVQHWSRQLALAFCRALEDPASGMVRFPSYAAYCARFIGELVHGRGWDSWLYRRFDGLRMLPAAAAIRTLLTQDGGLETLALIDDRVWPLLLATLTSREAVRILSCWHDRAEPSSDAVRLRAALGLWTASPPMAPGTLPAPLLALWLLAHAGTGDARSIAASCWLALMLCLHDSVRPDDLRRIARYADLRGLAALSAASNEINDVSWVSLLVATPAPARAAVAELAIAARHASGKAPGTQCDLQTEYLDAPFGGLVWLLPALHDLLGKVLLALLPSPGADVDALDVAALAILAIVSGGRSHHVWRDPFWRTFFRVPPAYDHAALRSWLAPHEPAAFNHALADALQCRTLTDAVMLRFTLHGTRHEQLAERGSACRLHPGVPSNSLAAQPLPFAERLRLTRLLQRDSFFLQSAHVLHALPPAWHAPFETMAQAVLRRTAFRVPGAACCSLPYLFANILDVRGQGRGDGAVNWSLDLNRPPLHVLLSLNGMSRQRLHWPGGRNLALHCTG